MPINLAPKELLEESSLWKKLFQWSSTVGRVIIVGTQIVVLGAFFSRFSLDRRLLDLSEKVKTKQAIVNATSSLEKNFRETQNKLEIIKNLKLSQNQYSQTIEQLTQMVPKTVTIDRLDLKEDTLVLNAKTPSGAEFVKFLTQLFTWKDLSQVVLKNARLSRSGGFIFNLEIKIKPDSYRFQLSSCLTA